MPKRPTKPISKCCQTIRVGVGLLVGCVATPHLVQADTLPTNSRLVASVFNEVYELKIATGDTEPKAAYGSCFVVDTNGLLATNFHVVAFALHEPDKYHLYLLDGDHTLPADVVAIDAVNDLALVHVDKTFAKAVRFAPNLPDTGDKIYSIGWPEDLNKSVAEGNFNGLMTAGPYRKLQMSIPLNPGMSGGPTINEQGELIGVNVSLRLDSQNLAFAVPKELLKNLMKQPQAEFSKPEDRGDFDEEVRSQIEHVQEQLTSVLLKGGSTVVTIGDWRVRKPHQMVKCWHEEETGPRGQTTVTSETCYLPGAAPVRSDVDTATFRVKYQAVANHELNPLQFTHYLNELLSNFGFSSAETLERFTTRLSCHELDLINTQKVPMRVHYCVNAYVRYAESYNLEMEAVTLTRDPSALLIAGSFLGFSSHNALEILRQIVNSVRPEPP